MVQRNEVLEGIEALVVDRNNWVSRAIQMILEQEGCHVHTVATGEEAIFVHRRRPCDLVLVDIPEETGTGQLNLHLLRTDPSTCILPILAVAREDSGDTRWTCLAAGADDLVRKPLTPRDLVRKMTALLGNIRSLGQARRPSTPSPLESVFTQSLQLHRKMSVGRRLPPKKD